MALAHIFFNLILIRCFHVLLNNSLSRPSRKRRGIVGLSKLERSLGDTNVALSYLLSELTKWCAD